MQSNEPIAKVGVTTANLSIRAVGFSTLEAICEALNCQSGDILGYQP